MEYSNFIYTFIKNIFMTTRKKGSGGPRSNAGRKRLPDPKQPIFIYVPTSVVIHHGGKDAVKLFAEQHLQKVADMGKRRV